MFSFDEKYFKDKLREYTNTFEAALEVFCQERPDNTPQRLWDSMTYSLLAGGKRLRPVLAIAAADMFGLSGDKVMPMALALEIVHTASLIHDDLPCMDNDTMRRGKPTNHVLYGETLATLAGDAMLCYAFELSLKELMQNGIAAKNVIDAVHHFANSCGPSGMCGGQVLDTDSQSQEDGRDFVAKIASFKTMVLIRTSLVSATLLSDAGGEDIYAMTKFGEKLGLAFQIADDILDVVGDQGQMGKTLGKDEEQGKRTFVSSYGLEGAREMLKNLTDESLQLLSPYGEKAKFLANLAVYLQNRTN